MLLQAVLSIKQYTALEAPSPTSAPMSPQGEEPEPWLLLHPGCTVAFCWDDPMGARLLAVRRAAASSEDEHGASVGWACRWVGPTLYFALADRSALAGPHHAK